MPVTWTPSQPCDHTHLHRLSTPGRPQGGRKRRRSPPKGKFNAANSPDPHVGTVAEFSHLAGRHAMKVQRRADSLAPRTLGWRSTKRAEPTRRRGEGLSAAGKCATVP